MFCSLLWAADIIWRENILSIRHFWEGYPHVNMTFMFKFFFIVQVCLYSKGRLRTSQMKYTN